MPAAPSRGATALSVGLQAAGAAATLLIGASVTRSFGVSAQGEFALIKGWTDTLAMVAMLGMPQALLHLSYRHPEQAPELVRWIGRFVAFWLVLALVAAALLWFMQQPALVWPVLAAPLLVAHGLLRSVLLRSSGLVAYAAITALPAAALLAAVWVLIALNRPDWGLAIGVAALASAAVAWACRPAPRAGGAATLPRWSALWSTNAHAFAQNVLAAAQLPLVLSLLGVLGASDQERGELALGLLFLQALGALASFAAPALYDRAARGRSVPDRAWSLSRGMVVAGGLAVPVALACWLAPAALPALLPPSETASPALVAGVRWAIVGGALLMCARLLATVLQARGQFGVLSAQAVWRLLLCLGGLAVLVRLGQAPAVAGCAAWAGAEAVLALHGAWALAQRRRVAA